MNRSRLSAPLRVSLMYLVLVAGWFVLFDLIYFSRPDFPPQLVPVQILRNLAFAVISTIALYGVVGREFRSRADTEVALQDSEARYRSILDAMEEGVVLQDATGHIVTCNASAERILGLSRDQLMGLTSLDPRWQALHEDGSPFPGDEHPAMIAVRAGQSQSNVIMGLAQPTGGLTWLSVNARPLFRPAETRPYAVVVTFGDITARKQAEQALQLAEAGYRTRLEQRVAERTQDLASLLDISHQLATTLELKPLLNLILKQIHSIIDYTFALILVVADNDMALEYDYVNSIGDLRPISNRPPLDASQLQAILTAGREPISVTDVTGDSPDAQFFQRSVAPCLSIAAVRAWLWTPLVVNERLIGGISLAHATPNHYADHHVGLLTTIANQAAVAIENARLYAEARELATLQERQRLARELHDSVTQQLFSASLIAEVLPQLYQQDQTEGREYLDDVRRLTRGALAEMRTLLMELRPAALHEATLIDLVSQLAEAFTGRTRVPVEIAVTGDPTPSVDVKIAVYRVAQEALNNIAKHAKARHVRVNLKGAGGTIELQIADDGRGFDRANVRPDRLGLNIMHERAQSIGAAITIESEVGRGTTIRIVWPQSKD
jgi:PAS domain S-box-containing protein